MSYFLYFILGILALIGVTYSIRFFIKILNNNNSDNSKNKIIIKNSEIKAEKFAGRDINE